MKRLIILMALAMCARAQNPNTAVYPAAAATDSDLLVASPIATSTLTAALTAGGTSITVADGSLFRNYQVVTIELERIKVCTVSSNTLTVCSGGRGFDGTVAASHASGKVISAVVSSYAINQMAAEIKAIETYAQTKAGDQAGAGRACADAGANDSYTCTMTPTLTAYTTGMVINFSPNTSNTGPCSLAIDGLSTISIKKSDGSTDPDNDDLYAGRYYLLTYDGTYFRLPATVGSPTATALTSASESTALGALFAAAASSGRAMTQTDLTWDSGTGLSSPKGVSTGDGLTAGSTTWKELAANGDNFRKIYVPDTLTADLSMVFPNSVPGASGGYLFLGAPSSDISTMAFHAPSGNTTTVATAATTRTTGMQVQFDAIGNLEATAYAVGAGGLNLTDLTTYEAADEFTEYMADERPFGWKRYQTGDCDSYSEAGDANHPGIYRLYCYSATPQIISMYRSDVSTYIVNPSANYTWTGQFVFALSAATAVTVYVGFSDDFDDATPNNFIGLRFDTGSSDSNWMYVACAAETCTATSSGVAADTAYHRVRFRGTASGTYAFCLDACSSETEIKTNVPTADLFPVALLVQTTSASKNLYVDHFYIKRTGLSRY